MKSLSCVWLFATPWTIAYQAPLSVGFSRQKYWSGLSLPSPDWRTGWSYFLKWKPGLCFLNIDTICRCCLNITILQSPGCFHSLKGYQYKTYEITIIVQINSWFCYWTSWMTSVIFFSRSQPPPTLPEEVGVEATDFVHLFFFSVVAIAPGRVPATQ